MYEQNENIYKEQLLTQEPNRNTAAGKYNH